MRQISPIAALALLTLAAPAPAAAPAKPAGNPDVRCLMLSNLFAKAAPEAQAKAAAAQSRLFYLGRVTAKLAAAQLAPAMAAAAQAIDPDHVGIEMNKCLATVQSSAAQVEAAGAKAKGTSGPQAPGR